MRKCIIGVVMMFLWGATTFASPELTAQRTYNQKVYDLGNGKKNYKIHVAQIHYKDGNDFKDIDTRLSFSGGKWQHSKASYCPAIPEYADGWFDFYNNYEGANHTISVKPVVNHVKGEYTHDIDGSDFVLYKDAFGKGIDLKVYSYWAGLKKVIIINEKPVDTSKDLTFDFELQLPTDNKFEIRKEDDTTFNFKTQSAQLDFTDKTIRLGTDGKYSYFRNASMWDSDKLHEKVKIELYRSGTKLFLHKTIPAEFLQKAVYPVYTDHPTSYYAGAGDGVVSGNNNTTNWATSRAATDGVADYTTAYNVVFQGEYFNFGTPTWAIAHIFFPVDTSGIGDTDTIISATFNIYVYTWVERNLSEATNPANIALVETSQASTSQLVGTDFDNIGTTRLCDTDLVVATLYDSAGYKSMTLNAGGLVAISKTSFTKLGFRASNDFSDATAPTARSYGKSFFSEQEGSIDPYLDVTTEGAPPATSSWIMMVN